MRKIILLLALSLVSVFFGPMQAEAAVSDRPVAHVQVKGNPGQDGEVLTTAITSVRGTRVIILGGNFDYLLLPNGRKVGARNLAVVSLHRPNEVIFAGNANSHVRAVSVSGSRLYVGGDFTNIQGQNRRHVAAFSRDNMSLLGFNPGSDRPVYGLDAAKGRVIYGGKSSVVRAASASSGQVIWTKPKTTGDVKVVFFHPNGNSAYVGGLFDSFAGKKIHGLVRVNARTGKLYKFNARFRFDRPLNHYNGDSVLSLAWGNRRLIVGSGGAAEKNSKNALWSLNASTGSWKGSGWRGKRYIRHSADVQAVGVLDGRVYTGFHRNVPNFRRGHGRFASAFNLKTGRPIGSWNPGFWGNQGNQAGSNNGISSISVGYGYLAFGGAQRGTGDYRRKDKVGRPGQHRQGLAIFR